MVEKIKNYLYVKEKQESFGIITVYPYLSYENGSAEKDRQAASEFSHSGKKCNYLILTRSKEAQEEIVKHFLAKSYWCREKDNIDLGLSEREERCIQTFRRWYSTDTKDILDLLKCRTGIGIEVRVDLENIEKFKEDIRELEKKDYLNIWKWEENKVLIG